MDYKLTDYLPLKIVFASRVKYRGRLPFYVAAHTHPFFTIWVVLHGALRTIVADREVRIKEGMMAFLMPFVRHGDVAGAMARHDALQIKFELKGDWARLLPLQTLQVCHHIPKFTAIVQAWQSRDELRQISAQLDLAGLLLRLAGDARYRRAEIPMPNAGQQAGSARWGPLMKYAWERVGDKITVRDLARRANMQADYFSRSFRAAMGFTPSYYLQRIKSEKACELLSRGATCKSAALALGFHSPAHFIRFFRRFNHYSPMQWVQRHADHPAPTATDTRSGQFFF